MALHYVWISYPKDGETVRKEFMFDYGELLKPGHVARFYSKVYGIPEVDIKVNIVREN